MGDRQLGDIYYDAKNICGYGGVYRLRCAANSPKNVTDAWLRN